MRALLPLLLLCACADSGAQQEQQQPSTGPRTSQDDSLIAVEASYDPRLFGGHVLVRIHNRRDELVCLESSDLRPGSGSSFVGNANGEVINDSGNVALAYHRGVNLISPLVVIRPRREYDHYIELGEFAGQARRLQVGIRAFKCSEFFGPGDAEPHFDYTVNSYRLEGDQAIPAEPIVRDDPPRANNPG